MSIKTIYKCDKCGSEQESSDQFWTVGVTANCSNFASRNFVEGKSMQVCRPCLESFGIHVRHKPDDTTPQPPTLEDLIREIVYRCVNHD